MKALSIRQPDAEAIMRGVKPIDFRSRSTDIRGQIYIYASLWRYIAQEEAKMMKMYGMTDIKCDDLPRGVLIGTVDIWDCTGKDRHFHWHIRNPQRAIKMLKPTNHPKSIWFDPF
jgi:hypothetical protein